MLTAFPKKKLRNYIRSHSNKLLGVGLILFLIFVGTSVISRKISASAHGRPLSAYLSGINEVPTGDLDGHGDANLTLNLGQNTICYEMHVEGIKLPAVAAHIHAGNTGTNGPIIVSLGAPNESGNSSGCIYDVDEELIKAVRLNPDSYYINVHNSDYPNGAIRGQLNK